MPIASINPHTGETLKTFDALSEAQIDARLERAVQTFRSFRRTSIAERAGMLLRVAEILESEQTAIARVMTNEMGKLLTAARDEALKCAWGCRFYAENAARFLADEPAPSAATHSFVRYQPLGAVLAVMPWNFPFWQALRLAAPALMAGNVVLLKHASNVPQCALLIEELFRRAGFPEGAFTTLLIGSDQVERVIDDPRIAGVSLTGSESAGRDVAAAAGKQLKKTVLELGGSDPFIVMPSADIASAVETAVKARVINNGQSCIAAKRFIVHQSIADRFEREFTARMQALRVGDPMDPSTDIGPLATPATLRDLDSQVRRSLEAGARLVTGGHALPGPGNHYVPTVLADIPPTSPAYSEELFGPVAALFRIRDVEEAVTLANDTCFGLGCSVWTGDVAERDRFVDEIEAGQVFVNGMVASDPRLPFGGVKHSGYGRELAVYGIREFVNIKTVWIKE